MCRCNGRCDREPRRWGRRLRSGLAVGHWRDTDDLRRNWQVAHTWQPAMTRDRRDGLVAGWRKAVERSFGWA